MISAFLTRNGSGAGLARKPTINPTLPDAPEWQQWLVDGQTETDWHLRLPICS
jgi:hypothetical protein